MTALLSLPPELLLEIIQLCPQRGRCYLRATCRVLNELAESIVFRRFRLYLRKDLPHVTERQIIALVTVSSRVCELIEELKISFIPDRLRASEQSWPQFGPCDDLRVHLPTAISNLRNLRHFRWYISDHDPSWLVNSLMQSVARLPQLTEVDIHWFGCKFRIPVGLFSNLSKLSIFCDQDDHLTFISQMATVIANSPRLRSLDVRYLRLQPDGVPRPALSDLFAKVPRNKPLYLEQLSIKFMDATVNQATLPHLMHLTSFEFLSNDGDLDARVWTSFLVNNIQLSDVTIRGAMEKEMMAYLLSFSGLERLSGFLGSMENMFFTEVLPKHVNSLQTLQITGLVFDHTNSKMIMSCLKLRDLTVRIDGEGMTVQLLLDTVAGLPELKILRVWLNDPPQEWGPALPNFKPNLGLQYVEELEVEYIAEWETDQRWYVLENDKGRPVGYREIPSFDYSDSLMRY